MNSRHWSALNAFLISIAFIPGIAGAATSPRWAVASLSLFYMRLGPALFAAYCLFSLRLDHAIHWAMVCAAFSWGLVSDEATRHRVAVWFACGICISGLIAIAQYCGWKGIFQIAPPAGLFANKNILAEAACLSLLAILGTRDTSAFRYILIAVLCLSIALTTTRSVYLALILCCLLAMPWIWQLLLCSFLSFLAWFYLDHATLDERFTLWATVKPSWFGNGDWWFNVRLVDDYMHNDWLQLFHEIGIIGLAPLIVLVGCFLVCRRWADRGFCVALFTIGSFGFPLQMPATAWFAAFVLGTFLFKPAAERRIFFGARLENA